MTTITIKNPKNFSLVTLKKLLNSLDIEIVKIENEDQEEIPAEHLQSIKKGLEEKLEAMVRRDLYTKYKTAPTEEEREKARQEYLKKVGMHRSFRW